MACAGTATGRDVLGGDTPPHRDTAASALVTHISTQLYSGKADYGVLFPLVNNDPGNHADISQLKKIQRFFQK